MTASLTASVSESFCGVSGAGAEALLHRLADVAARLFLTRVFLAFFFVPFFPAEEYFFLVPLFFLEVELFFLDDFFLAAAADEEAAPDAEADTTAATPGEGAGRASVTGHATAVSAKGNIIYDSSFRISFSLFLP